MFWRSSRERPLVALRCTFSMLDDTRHRSTMARRTPLHARPREGVRFTAGRERRGSSRTLSVEGNTRLTSSLGAILLVLLFLEGLTIVSIGSLLSAHIVIGMLLIPPVLLKIGSTSWRMIKYYAGSRAYRRKGPPAPLLRLLGPIVVVLTVILLASGVGLVVGAPVSWRPQLFTIHRASFVLWFAAMAIHVLGHLVETARFAPRDVIPYTRRQVKGASARQWALAAALALGVIAAVGVLPYAANWRAGFFG